MTQQTAPSAAYHDSKPHYQLLDGLRGVAALMVLIYHVFEGFATSAIDQRFNHGYLAVDFFFILSGFVVGYAYDDRFPRMSTGNFIRRRLIRLHPMIVMGAVLGAITYCIQGQVQWDGTHVSLCWVGIALLLNFFLLPALPGSGADVRGNNEMFSLNGPTWSLFFEYIANLAYVFFLRRLSTPALKVFVGIMGCLLAAFGILNLSGAGHLGVGWSLTDYNLPGGLLRVGFSFSMGLLMSRIFRPKKVRGAFWICSLILFCLMAVPHVGDANSLWMNGLYDAFCVIIAFPALVWLGASGQTTDVLSTRVCKFLGDISFPVYAVHYPFMYLYYAWVWDNGLSFEQTIPVALLLLAGCICLAYLCLKFYDEPIRRRLTRRFLPSKPSSKP